MISDEELQRLTDLEASATPGDWFYNSYSGIFSNPLVKSYDAAEREIPDDAPDDDPLWAALPEPVVASVPAAYGDTATGRHAVDAAFIAESRNVFPELLKEVKELRAWANRMPDAGLTVDDPRYAWWIERPGQNVSKIEQWKDCQCPCHKESTHCDDCCNDGVHMCGACLSHGEPA